MACDPSWKRLLGPWKIGAYYKNLSDKYVSSPRGDLCYGQIRIKSGSHWLCSGVTRRRDPNSWCDHDQITYVRLWTINPYDALDAPKHLYLEAVVHEIDKTPRGWEEETSPLVLLALADTGLVW